MTNRLDVLLNALFRGESGRELVTDISSLRRIAVTLYGRNVYRIEDTIISR